MNKYFLIIAFLLNACNIYSQEVNSGQNCKLCGFWKTIKKTDLKGSDGRDKTITGNAYSTDYGFEFSKDSITLFLDPYSYKFKYSLKDSIISYHNEELIIHSYNKKSMILVQKGELGGSIYHMKKQEKD